MSELSPEQEQRIVEALTDPKLDWMPDLDGTSHQIISETCKCSMKKAKRILKGIYVERHLIEAVSKSGGVLTDAPIKSLWKWKRT